MDTKVTMHMVALNNHVVITFSQPMGVLQFTAAEAKVFFEQGIKIAESLIEKPPTQN